MGRVQSYRVVLPKPWIRVPVGSGTEARVVQLVEERVRTVPKDLPPDQVGPMKRELARRLTQQILATKEYGGIDFYLPADTSHGLLIGASFVVSQVRPPGQLPDDMPPDRAVGEVMAQLIRDAADATAVTIAGQAWVRSRRVVEPNPDRAPGVDVPMVSVTYTTALPDDPASWVVVEFSGTGDGDPESASTTVLVELFDAIMSTWRWIVRDDGWADDADHAQKAVG